MNRSIPERPYIFPVRARVVGTAPGAMGVQKTPHDGRWVKSWNPHTVAGILELTSTDDPREARVFALMDLQREYRTISRVQPTRPWDGEPNRPLTGVSLEIDFVKEHTNGKA